MANTEVTQELPADVADGSELERNQRILDKAKAALSEEINEKKLIARAYNVYEYQIIALNALALANGTKGKEPRNASGVLREIIDEKLAHLVGYQAEAVEFSLRMFEDDKD
jgi:hypothetical protein